jgi:hypothetical protein
MAKKIIIKYKYLCTVKVNKLNNPMRMAVVVIPMNVSFFLFLALNPNYALQSFTFAILTATITE